jgi:UDP:flavonoid glycosyltransferase YjiC (YdhE family)
VVTEALLLGKPVLAAPTNGASADNAARITYLGAGLHVDPHKTTRFELRSLVEQLLKDDACRARSISLSRSLAFTDGPAVAAGLIERLAFTREPVRRPAGCTPSLFRDSPLPWERRDLLVVH